MEYQVVNIPIKRTSSEYYARLREEREVKRNCPGCGQEIKRRFNPDNQRWEDWSSYAKRKYCSNECRLKAQREGTSKYAPEGYKPTEISGLHVNWDGEFWYHGKPKKVTFAKDKFGRKCTARIVVGKTYRQASSLVAKAFLGEGRVIYKDKDIHNISASNLKIVSEEEYNRYMSRGLTPGSGTDDFSYQKRKLEMVIESANAVLYYFETKDMSKVNDFVRIYLYKELMDFGLRSLCLGSDTAVNIATECICHMYDVILSGHALYNIERFCKKLMHDYKTKGKTKCEYKTLEMQLVRSDLEKLALKFNKR